MNPLASLDAAPLATALLNGLWLGLLLATLVFAALWLLGQHRPLNASTRYVAQTALLAVLVCLPLGTLHRAAPAEQPIMTPTEIQAIIPAPPIESTLPSTLAPVATSSDSREMPAVVPSTPTMRTWQLPAALTEWMTWVVGIWLVGAGILLLRIGRSLWAVRRLKRTSTALPPRYQAQLMVWQRHYSVRRRVQLRGTEALATPVAAGYFRPAILVPYSLMEALTPAEFEQVVLHELAHLHRRDDWTNLFQQLAQAIFFFHPAVHLTARAMDRTREVACDDWVVARTQQPHAYASCLTRLVELDLRQRGPLLAPGMAAQQPHLFARVRRLLAQGRGATTRLSKANLMLLGLMLAAVYLLVGRVAPGFAPPASERALPVTQVALPPEPNAEPHPPQLAPPPPAQHAAPEPRAASRASAGATLASQTEPTLPSLTSASALQSLAPLPLAEPQPQSLPTPAVAVPAPADLSLVSWKRVLRAATKLASSGEKGRFLRESAPKLPADAGVFAAYIDAANTITSPSERRRSLAALLDHHRLGPATLRLLIDAVPDLSASSERVRLLQQIARVLPEDPALREAYRQAAEHLTSRSDYRRAMNALR